jgi:hypothetical protein
MDIKRRSVPYWLFGNPDKGIYFIGLCSVVLNARYNKQISLVSYGVFTAFACVVVLVSEELTPHYQNSGI